MGQGLRRPCKFDQRSVEEYFHFVRVGEGLDLAQGSGERSFLQQAMECSEHLSDRRREDGACLNSAEQSRACLEIANGRPASLISRVDLPLGTVSITQGRRGARLNRAFPLQAPDPRERFPKNFGLVLQLGFMRDVLVMAPAADTEMRAGSGHALGRR